MTRYTTVTSLIPRLPIGRLPIPRIINISSIVGWRWQILASGERGGLDRGLNGGRSHVEIVRHLAPLASRHVLIPADPSAGPGLSPDPIGGLSLIHISE